MPALQWMMISMSFGKSSACEGMVWSGIDLPFLQLTDIDEEGIEFAGVEAGF